MAAHAAPTTANPAAPVTPSGWARLALYVVAVLAGLAAVLAAPLGFGQLTELLYAVSGLLLVATGGTAALNLGKADDQKINLRELVPVVQDVVAEVRDLRERQPGEVADEVEKRVANTPAPVTDAVEPAAPTRTPEPTPAPSTPSSGNELLDALRELVEKNRA